MEKRFLNKKERYAEFKKFYKGTLKDMVNIEALAEVINAYFNYSLEEAEQKISWLDLACSIKDEDKTVEYIKFIKKNNIHHKTNWYRDLGDYKSGYYTDWN